MDNVSVKVPPTIKIGCHTYRVRLVKDLEDSGSDAEVNHKKETISIDPTTPLVRRNVSLIHEALHIISRVYHIDLGGEGVVGALSEGLGEFLLTNLGLEFNWEGVDNVE